MYDEILLPTDGSSGVAAAIEHAIHVASQNDAVLHAVHVLEMSQEGPSADPSIMMGDDVGADVDELLEPIREAAEASGVDVVDAVLRGPTHEKLLEYAQDNDIDLIVMGTTGKSGLSRILLGSTAEEVVRNAPMPVMTVREGAE